MMKLKFWDRFNGSDRMINQSIEIDKLYKKNKKQNI